MCYDISFSTSIELVTKYLPALDLELARQMDLSFRPLSHFVGHAYPTLPVIINDDGHLQIKAFEWGLVAGYMNTPELIKKNRKWMLNARSEKILDKKAFWYRVRQNRCVVPVTGFYEHREVSGMKTKVPYFIHRTDQPVMFMAGLYNYAPVPHEETGEMVGTFTIITREANTLMKAIHTGGDNAGRMPLQLGNDMLMEWLKPGLTDTGMQQMLNFSFPADQLEAWPVYSIRGRSGRPDGKEKFEPFDYAGLPAL